MRLDAWLAQNGYFPSRQKAQLAIKAGHVRVNDQVITKASFQVQSSDVVRIVGQALRYVSQGGQKLEKAIRHFKLDLTGKRVLDAGASTGGFTDCSLQHGAQVVYAVDIGTDQLDGALRKDPRVHCYEKTDIRKISLQLLDDEPVEVIVADLSFISLTQVLPVFRLLLAPSGFLLALIKPQFELEQKIRFKKGIIKDNKLRQAALQRVIETAEEYGFSLQGLVETDVADENKKNLEYLALFHPEQKKR